MSNDADPEHGLEDRFQILADETRIRILNALADATGRGETPIAYSTLQSRVGVRDNGRLNYHLSKLADEFVTRTEAGYALLPAGWFAHLVARAQERDVTEPVQFDAKGDCHHCGEGLVATYGPDHTFVVRCPACDRVYLTLAVPFVRPDAAAPSAFLDAVNDTAHERFALLAGGRCPWCRSPVETAVVSASDSAAGREPRRQHVDVHFRHRCRTCAADVRTTPGEILLAHPEIMAIHRRRGIALTDRYVWTVSFAVTDQPVSVESRDPWRIVLRTTAGETDIRSVVDGNGDVQVVSTQSHFRGV